MPSDDRSDPLSVGFRDVDSTRSDKILRCLHAFQEIDAVRNYKASALEHLELEPGSAALDVACGLGDDVAAMKARCARADGADRSLTLLAQARARHAGLGCVFSLADAAHLPFADGRFDAVRVDRSLQHINNPGRVIREMSRVTRRGGIVLCAEPDWGTYLIGGPHSAVVERIQRDWIKTFRNPWIGRELSSMLAAAGVVDRRCEEFWLPTHGFAQSDILFEIDATVGLLSPELPEARPWLETYRDGEAYAGVLMMIWWGRKA